MADPRRKYVCRSDVALVETHSFGIPFCYFPFSGGIRKRSSAGYDRKVPEYTEFLRKIQPRCSVGIQGTRGTPGSRSRAARQRVQRRAVETGESGSFSRWTGDPRP